MASFNLVVLMGNLTRAPELKYTPSGKALAKFGLAVSEKFTRADGTKGESVAFLDIAAWGKLGETVSQHLKKGSPALVQGKLTQSQWEAPDGSKRSKIEVNAASVRFLPRPRAAGADGPSGGPEEATAAGAGASPVEPDTTGGVGDDEVPF